MRMPRIKLPDSGAVYHCVSRVTGKEFLLDDACKEALVQLLWKMAGFCGVEVITYCMMANHFHVLIRVPSLSVVSGISDAALVARLARLYGDKGVLTTLARESIKHRGKIDDDLRARIVSRMGDVSGFMKEFKQRFSRWYNRNHDREGTLWSERFRSVLVEDQPNTVEAVAAYIDLNPVRAGLVEDPKDYRFCGYAAALAGNKLARKGLMSIQTGQISAAKTQPTSNAAPSAILVAASQGVIDKCTPSTPSDIVNDFQLPNREALSAQTQASPSQVNCKSLDPSVARWNSWSDCASGYRMRLFIRAGNVHQSGKMIVNREKIHEVLKQGGELSLAEVFRLRVRHMTDGLALGTKKFVNEVFLGIREKFPATRKEGARPIRFLSFAGLNALRDLQVRVLG